MPLLMNYIEISEKTDLSTKHRICNLTATEDTLEPLG